MPESRSRKKRTYTPPPPKAKVEKGNPPWLVPTMLTLMIAGLAWVVATYLFRNAYPIPGIGNWNLAIGFALMISGFVLTLRWR